MHGKPFVYLFSVLILAVVMIPQACKPKSLGSLPEIGKTMIIKPAVLNATGIAGTRSELAQAIYLQINWGGRPLRIQDQATVEFYRLGEGKPAAVWPWEKLAAAHTNTGCDGSSLKTLEQDAEGVALVCDGSLPIDDFTKIVVKTDKKERSATSWSTFMKTPEVYAASIQTF